MSESDQGSPQNLQTPVPDFEELLNPHTNLPTTGISERLDGFVSVIGKGASWLWVAVTGVIVWAVVARYVFGQGSVFLEEVEWHLAGIGWLLGLGYTLVADDHVRVDVIHERLSLKAQSWIELLGLVFLLSPFLCVVIYELIPYTVSSWEVGEISQAPAGLSYRWALKGAIAVGFILIQIAAISRLLKTTAVLFGFPRPIRIKSEDNKKEDAS